MQHHAGAQPPAGIAQGLPSAHHRVYLVTGSPLLATRETILG